MQKSKKRKVIILSVIIGILIVLFFGMSYFIGSQVVEGSTKLVTNEETREMKPAYWQMNNMDPKVFRETYHIDTVYLDSTNDEHKIPVEYISSKEECLGTVVMVHGLGANRTSNYPIAELFLQNGYNVLTYDQRSTNENTAENTTFGYLEKFDLIDCIDYAKQHTESKVIGVWGESFGGATAVQAMAYNDVQKDIAFMILDCPVSSMEWMVREEIIKMDTGLPTGYLIWCGNIMNRLTLGFSYKDADSVLAAEHVTIPVLVMNSKADQTTPYFMGKDIYDHLAGDVKEIWTVDDSKHTELWIDFKEEYTDRVMRLVNIGVNNFLK